MNLEDIENNEPLGRRIFESIPKGSRAKWGANLLKAVSKYIDDFPEVVTELLAIIEDGRSLSKAKEQFSKINDFAAVNPDYKPAAFLLLAEGVAKMTYNETGLPDPFAVNAAWYVPLSCKRTADKINESDLDEEITRLISAYLKAD